MYCDFYQLRERPFNVTADPRFLYLNSRYREALASLEYGISQRKGFVALIGEAGTGKTTLLKKLLDDLDRATRTVFIFNTNVTFDEILEYTFSELDLPVHNGKRLYMLQRLNDFLLEELRAGRNVALLIDEAQDLDYSVLEDLRLLSNLETANEKILQIVLSGQPELVQKLANSRLRQLRQRIAVNCRLHPLTRQDLSEYIQSRLAAAGGADPRLFSRDAEDRIFEISGGIPRLVNVLCDNALVIGYALGKKKVNGEVVNEAAADLLPVEPVADDSADEGTVSVVPPPIVEAPRRERRVSQVGIVAAVLAAIVVGLLSVGRNLLRKESDALATAQVGLNAMEVIQPGSEPESARQVVVDPGATGRRSANPAGAPRVEEHAGPVTAAQVHGRNEGEQRQGLGERGRTDPRLFAEQPLDEREPVEVRVPEVTDEGVEIAEKAAVAGRDGGRGVWPPPRPLKRAQPRKAAVSSERKRSVRGPEAVAALPGGATATTDVEAGAALVDEQDFVPEERLEKALPGEQPPEFQVSQTRYRRVVVGRGDSFSAIAYRAYGQAGETILDVMKLANPTIRDVDVIPVGQRLRLPEFEGGFIFLKQRNGKLSLLLLSTSMRGRANEMAAALRLRGLDARVVSGQLKAGRPIWRVLVGGFSTRDEAQNAGRQLRELFRDDARLAAMAR